MRITVTAAEYRRLISALVMAEDWQVTSAYANALYDGAEHTRNRESADEFRKLRHRLLRADRGDTEGER